MGNMKKANYIISVIMLLIGVGIVALASSLKIKLGEGDPGAGFWPKMLPIQITLPHHQHQTIFAKKSYLLKILFLQSQKNPLKKNLKQKHLQLQHRQI